MPPPQSADEQPSTLHRVVAARLLDWYREAERALPWRASVHGAWGVYVSEVMAQQTQVQRVAAVWPAWMERWPTPAALAESSPADVVRAWGRLGYPRRALWMHAAATEMVRRHAGEVPRSDEALRALPGVGEYTAAAIRAFAFAERVPVLDVNVRRVHARLFHAQAQAPTAVTNAERAHHDGFLPEDPATAATLSQAVMEFGALVCTARDPGCEDCPLADACRWRAAGSPASQATTRRQSRFEGSDRQCRGALMRVLREADGAASEAIMESAWPDAVQRQRCLEDLLADGLAVRLPRRRFSLPT